MKYRWWSLETSCKSAIFFSIWPPSAPSLIYWQQYLMKQVYNLISRDSCVVNGTVLCVCKCARTQHEWGEWTVVFVSWPAAHERRSCQTLFSADGRWDHRPLKFLTRLSWIHDAEVHEGIVALQLQKVPLLLCCIWACESARSPPACPAQAVLFTLCLARREFHSVGWNGEFSGSFTPKECLSLGMGVFVRLHSLTS